MENTPSKKYLSGFTLVEILLYVSIVGIMLVVITSFFSTIITVEQKNVGVTEVEQNGIQVVEYLTFILRQSSSITTPTSGATSSVVSFNTNLPANNPTQIELINGVIQITEGTNPPVALTSNAVTASNLSFKNLSAVNTKPSIRFQFELTHKNPDNRRELNNTKIFYGTATLR